MVASMSTPDPVSILVVDDTPQNLVTLEAVLDEPGVNVVGARSAREALRYLLQQEFAAILLDVNMPDMDGLETATLIRQHPRSAHTPILFITAYPNETQLTRAYSLGAVDYMLTPVQPEVLHTKIAVFVDLYRGRLEVRRQAERLREIEQAQRQQAEQALRESEGRFRVLCTSAPLAIFQLDGQGRCVYVSPLWHATTGQHPDDARDYGWADAICPGDADDVLTSWQQALSEQRIWTLERQIDGAGGERRWVHVKAGPILAEDGQVIGHVGTIEDVTPRKQTEERLREADRRKDEFLAMLAHELRNPLAAISSAVLVARTPGLEDRRDWSLQVVTRQVEHLSKLIDDLMDVSRITLGKIELRPERLDLAHVLGRAVDTVQPAAVRRNQQIQVAVPVAPLWTHGDPTRLEQVFVNLLGNALKYSSDDGRVRLSAATDDGDLVVRVRDEGIGMEPAMLASIFELFTQAHSGFDRSKGGLGIGLSLARSLTELHGGRITAHSDGLGSGSEFTVRLPAAAAPESAGKDAASRALTPRHGAATVLLVDDNVDATNALALLLQASGYYVVTAHDGAEALMRAAELLPDFVLLDLGLPVKDGYDVASELRATPYGAAATILALSGYGQEQDRRRSREAGFDHHLVKPVDCAVLLDLLARGPRDGVWRSTLN
jgi:PAS domain S-box-containing protein